MDVQAPAPVRAKPCRLCGGKIAVVATKGHNNGRGFAGGSVCRACLEKSAQDNAGRIEDHRPVELPATTSPLFVGEDRLAELQARAGIVGDDMSGADGRYQSARWWGEGKCWHCHRSPAAEAGGLCRNCSGETTMVENQNGSVRIRSGVERSLRIREILREMGQETRCRELNERLAKEGLEPVVASTFCGMRQRLWPEAVKQKAGPRRSAAAAAFAPAPATPAAVAPATGDLASALDAIGAAVQQCGGWPAFKAAVDLLERVKGGDS